MMTPTTTRRPPRTTIPKSVADVADLTIIGTSIDRHIDAVLFHVDNNYRVVRLNLDEIPYPSFATLVPTGGKPYLQTGENRVSQSRVVWFRRLGMPTINRQIAEPAHRQFALGETEAFISGLIMMLREAVWISKYETTKSASIKPFQLQVAEACGLRVPRTVITSDPSVALEFIGSEPRALYKTQLTPTVAYKDRRTVIYTKLLAPSDITNIDQVANCPCLFQEYIDKNYELRITFTGDTMFAVRIDSQASPETSIDWRNGDWSTHNYQIYKLPDDVESKIFVLMKALGLSYGALDFIVTRESEYVFLEVNPHGAWLWLEEYTGAKISEALASFIMRSIARTS